MPIIDYSKLIKNMPVAYALHEMIYDHNGNAVDYRFIDVNNEFLELTGLVFEKVIGATCLELMPNTEHYWIEVYEECIKTGKTIQYDNYSKELERFYQVTAYSPSPNQFISLFFDITNRISEFNKSEKVAVFFKSITENATDAIVILDKDIKYSYVSPNAYKLTGYELHDVNKLNPAALTHPDDLVYLMPELQKLLENPSYKPTVSYRFKTKSGEWLWIESTFSNLFDNPEVQGIVINFRDISERKSYIEKLLLSEQRYRLTQEAGNIGSWEYYIDKKTYWNSAQLRQIFGIEDAVENINEEIENCILQNEYVKQTLKNLINDNKKYDIEFEINRKRDGKKRIIKSQAHLVYNSATNEAELVRGVLTDITDRKEYEIKLKKSEALLAATLIHSRFSIWSVDTNNNLLYANETFVDDFQKSFGKKLEVGKSIIDVMPDVLKPLWIERYKKAFANNSFIEEDVIDVGNEKIYIEVSTTPILIDGKVVGASFYGEDITARRTALIKLEESEVNLNESYQRFNKIFKSNPALMALTDVETNQYVDVNDTFLQVLGFEKYEIIGKTSVEAGIIHDINRFMVGHEILLKNGCLQDFEMDVQTKDGRILTGLFSGQYIENQGKKFSLSVMIDMTERKFLEKILQQKLDEMERFHKLTINRELNMIELKKEVNKLLLELGKDEKYRIVH